jgi:hypothetical protein
VNTTPESQALTPLQKLAQSRAHLRVAMQPLNRIDGAADDFPGESRPAFWNSLPGVGILREALEDWWAHHPLRMATVITEKAASALLRPTAQKHPVLLMAGAVLAGAVLVRMKPWRWGLKKAMFAGLLPHLISKVVSELPLASWIELLTPTGRQPPSETATSPSPARH